MDLRIPQTGEIPPIFFFFIFKKISLSKEISSVRSHRTPTRGLPNSFQETQLPHPSSPTGLRHRYVYDSPTHIPSVDGPQTGSASAIPNSLPHIAFPHTHTLRLLTSSLLTSTLPVPTPLARESSTRGSNQKEKRKITGRLAIVGNVSVGQTIRGRDATPLALFGFR